MIRNRITKSWLKNHMVYSWWKYLLLLAVCVMSVDMLFAITAYRVPEEKKVEIYILNSYVDADAVQAELAPLFFSRCEDQEELSVMNINIGSDDMYARMQFTTYMSARQGDIYMMPDGEIPNLVQEGAEVLVELTPYIESGVLDLRGIDVSRGVMKDSQGNEGVYAIPADSLYGLLAHGNDPAGSSICLPAFGGNSDNAVSALDELIGLYQAEKPEGYEQMRRQEKKQPTLF